MTRFISDMADSMVGKKKKCWLSAFLLFPQCLEKPLCVVGG